FHLAMDTLAFGYILPTTGRIPDLHRLETCAAGRTTETAALRAAVLHSFRCFDNTLTIFFKKAGFLT
ncbi:hypothetical protein, partial [Eisenbergiella tayi]|uniref:hypothetical protein n=1 Tax=Eisenbergiella tayi TaxID=1432052 RepID=UPI001A9A62A1